MARRKLSDVSHPDPLLTDDFWLQFGDDPQPPMRLKILYVTFGEAEIAGPGSFNVASVCDRLGITYPMVNHYFGGRDGLLAEGAYMVYERYVQSTWDAVTAAPRNPEARLKAWMTGQLAGNMAMGGWGPLLNYPLAAREVTEIIQEKFQGHMNRLFELNLARVSRLAMDLREGTVTDFEFTESDYPRDQYLHDSLLQRLIPTISWSTFGMSVWFAGPHTPARNIREVSDILDDVVENHMQLMVDIVRSSSE